MLDVYIPLKTGMSGNSVYQKKQQASLAAKACLLGQPSGLTHPHLMLENESEYLYLFLNFEAVNIAMIQ